MKQIDFEVVCPKCGGTNIVPLQVPDDKVIFTDSNFTVKCAYCYGDFKVTLQLMTEVVETIVH